jgi:hypothetical protein
MLTGAGQANNKFGDRRRGMFEAFWRATGEPPFDILTAACAECYRLRIETSLRPDHSAYRLQRPLVGVPSLVAHFYTGSARDRATVDTHRITVEEPLWGALAVLLEVARFWDLPEDNGRGGLDGATYTLEGWNAGRSHRVIRWSPDPVFSGGELLVLVTDYVRRLGELAVLECDPEIRSRYVPEYVPKRQLAEPDVTADRGPTPAARGNSSPEGRGG